MKNTDSNGSNQKFREEQSAKKDSNWESKDLSQPNAKDRDAGSTEKVNTTTTNDQRKSSVLLQTATAYAYNNTNSKRTNVRILFDSGSQRSYITNELKKTTQSQTDKTRNPASKHLW